MIEQQQLMKVKMVEVLTTGEYWRFCIEDFQQANGRTGFESGYITQLLRAFEFISTKIGQRLTIDLIKQLHGVAMLRVQGTSYWQKGEIERPGEFRKSGMGMTFGLDGDNSTEFGIAEMLIRVRKLKLPITVRQVQRGTMQERLRQVEFRQKEVYRRQIPSVRLIKIITSLLKQFYKELDEIADIDIDTDAGHNRKIELIARICRDLACMHPFLDGNGRMFCMLVPTMLLLQNDLDIPLLHDINIFAMFDLGTIINKIKQGFIDTRSLIENGVLPLSFPNQFITTEDDNLEYRRECVDVSIKILNGMRQQPGGKLTVIKFLTGLLLKHLNAVNLPSGRPSQEMIRCLLQDGRLDWCWERIEDEDDAIAIEISIFSRLLPRWNIPKFSASAFATCGRSVWVQESKSNVTVHIIGESESKASGFEGSSSNSGPQGAASGTSGNDTIEEKNGDLLTRRFYEEYEIEFQKVVAQKGDESSTEDAFCELFSSGNSRSELGSR